MLAGAATQAGQPNEVVQQMLELLFENANLILSSVAADSATAGGGAAANAGSTGKE